MKSYILCCFLSILTLANTAAIAGEDPKADSAQTASITGSEPGKNDAPADEEVKKERLHVQYFRVFYDPQVEADQLSGIDALSIHMRIYMRKYEDGQLEPKFTFSEYSNGARGVVWFER